MAIEFKHGRTYKSDYMDTMVFPVHLYDTGMDYWFVYLDWLLSWRQWYLDRNQYPFRGAQMGHC